MRLKELFLYKLDEMLLKKMSQSLSNFGGPHSRKFSSFRNQSLNLGPILRLKIEPI